MLSRCSSAIVLAGALLAAGSACVWPAVAQDAKWGVGSWPERGFGSHRAVVRVAQPAGAVWAHIEWRRRDRSPETKDVRVFDAATGQRVLNVVRAQVGRVSGDILFQPATAPGDYHIYYLPYNPGTGNFDNPGEYLRPEETADTDWRAANGLMAEGLAASSWKALPRAETVEVQARNEFCRMDPMEVIASPEETARLVSSYPYQAYLLFPEDRRYPIRMPDELPLRWIRQGAGTQFRGEARPGEYYTFQIGVYAARQALPGLALDFIGLKSDTGKTIPESAFTCINLGGKDWMGHPFKKTVSVAKGRVQPLWIGVAVPKDAAGTYFGAIHLRAAGADGALVWLELKVAGRPLADHGDSELWRYSRLRWLNSTLGIDDQVVPPYAPLAVKGDTVECLLRRVRFGSEGLPAAITSNGRQVLAAPAAFELEGPKGALQWTSARTRLLKKTPGTVERESVSEGPDARLTVWSRMEFDGCLTFRVTLAAKRNLALRDTRLKIPLRREVVPYMMGMGRRGGYRPREWSWAWNVERADQMVWLGDADAGLQLKLLGPKDVWEGVTLRDVGLPSSWWNAGKGGCTIREEGQQVVLRARTGPGGLRAGLTREFRFRMLVTPFKPIDRRHWSWRYGDVNGEGTVLHIHHGTPENPYINYPFLTVDRLAATAKHVKSLRTSRTDFGKITYPAEGNILPARGTLHVWARVDFDPAAGGPGQARFNQGLFYLEYPNEDSLGFYWNIDDRGMRTYTRRGAPSLNRYPVLFGTHSPEWRKGERHRLTLSWGDRLAIFVDGKLKSAAPYRGILDTPIEDAALTFQGGFALDAVKITDQPYEEGTEAAPVADEHTLLLDTFSDVAGRRSRPEKGSPGTIEGVVETPAGEQGKMLVFSSRTVEGPPKGVNVYNTVGQVSNYAAEMWALRSLGDEVFQVRPTIVTKVGDTVMGAAGGGYPWLREHLAADYLPGWRQPLPDGETDAAIITQGLSRWHNYYVEGMAWLMKNTGVDGLYLDGIGYDREIMKRVAKVMARTDPNSRMNFHGGDSWSPPWDQGRHVSTANQCMEHLPYISNLWFGELYDYSLSPDYWLVEVSGIPFGLTGEMLNYENGGNPYRAMVYGMSGRQHPSAPGMWRLWDEFGIQDAEMLGYWSPKCPVRTNRKDVLATVYRKRGKAAIALAHWPDLRPSPSAVARRAERAPVIDGRLDPGEWESAARLARFAAWGTEEPAAQATEAYVTYDDTRLYLGFRCAQAGTPKADATARDGVLWEDDSVEFLIQPDRLKDGYFQLIGNSKGVFYDGRGQDGSWNGPWEYRASAGSGTWEGEASIALSALGISLRAQGTGIGFNVCRDQQTPSRQLSGWSARGVSFHDVTHFGSVLLSPEQPPTREVPTTPGSDDVRVRLKVDWKALGLDPARVRLTAPSIAHFQPRAQFGPSDEIPVARARGWLLVAEPVGP